MLATLGILVAENFHPLFGNIDLPAYLSYQDTSMQLFWILIAGLIAIPESQMITAFDPDVEPSPVDGLGGGLQMKTNRVPGDFGFDPLGLRPKDPKAFLELQNKEILNGRLAMIGWVGMILQEIATDQKIFP